MAERGERDMRVISRGVDTTVRVSGWTARLGEPLFHPAIEAYDRLVEAHCAKVAEPDRQQKKEWQPEGEQDGRRGTQQQQRGAALATVEANVEGRAQKRFGLGTGTGRVDNHCSFGEQNSAATTSCDPGTASSLIKLPEVRAVPQCGRCMHWLEIPSSITRGGRF
jgi:hypothetical protein